MITENNQPIALSSFIPPLVFVALLWVIHLLQLLFSFELTYLGVYPRALEGVIGIFTSPLIHADFGHLTSNTFPFLVCSSLIMYFYKDIALYSISMIYVMTGVFVWCFARPVYHIGASGVVYGLVAFIFWCGIFVKDVRSIVLALIVTLLYSGMFLGVLPNQEGISWESHLFGGIVGIAVAYIFKTSIVDQEETQNDPWLQESEKNDFFLDRDAFDKTKQQRQAEQVDNNQWNATNTWD